MKAMWNVLEIHMESVSNSVCREFKGVLQKRQRPPRVLKVKKPSVKWKRGAGHSRREQALLTTGNAGSFRSLEKFTMAGLQKDRWV